MKGKSLISLSYIFILNIIFLVISGFYIPHAIAMSITVNLNLPDGISMISLPIIPYYPILSEVFPSAVVVYEYQKGTEYVQVKPDEGLEVGRGYWILLDQDTSYTFTGDLIASYTHPVSLDGWAMIGGCTAPAQVISHGCDIGVIYGYVQGIGLLHHNPLRRVRDTGYF
jgi:hypothetical protein